MNKIDAYIGFCIKKGCAVLGVDGIEVCRRKMHLILFSNDLADNSLKKLSKFASQRNCPMQEYDLAFLNRSCKAIALCDANLAKAVMSALKG